MAHTQMDYHIQEFIMGPCPSPQEVLSEVIIYWQIALLNLRSMDESYFVRLKNV